MLIGLQETRMSVARAISIALDLISAAAANGKGQGGVELWIFAIMGAMSHSLP